MRIRRTPSVPGQPKATDLWRTPPQMFAALHAEFAFDLDAAADTQNHLCPVWLGPGGAADDALAVRWADYGRRVFLNPPYSATLIRAFMAHARRQMVHGLDLLVVLVKLDPSTRWWEETRSAVEIREIPGRVEFLTADGITKAGAMFPSAVIVYRPQPGILRAQPRRVVWTYDPRLVAAGE